ncbi:MAG: prolipoprotein diacylglyceryl transferase [Clostridia bacterium]|nr:prolipoprotein diacylglyceryl transferase [Clostridia bacterium]
MEPFIYIFGKEIPIYGIAWILGTAIAGLIAYLLTKKSGIEGYDLVYSAVFAVLAGVAGAKLLFILVSLNIIIEQNIPFTAVLQGGFVFYGGLIGGAIGILIYTKMYKLNTLKFFDLFALVMPLGHAIGRVGCFYSGCCYGMRYDGPFSCEYTKTLGMTPLNTALLPVQLIEAVLLIILFCVLMYMYLKVQQTGIITVIYLYVYSVIRFVLEFLRGDLERGLIFGLSTSQIVSVMIVVFVTSFLIIKLKKKAVS